MPTVTVNVNERLKERMNSHPEINWSEVARQSFQEKVNELSKLELMNELLADSQLTQENVEELAALVNENAQERLLADDSEDM